MTAFRFEPNRQAVAELARSQGVKRFLKKVADDGAKEVDRRAPRIVKGSGMSIHGDVETTMSGSEGRIVVRSSFWHWPEYGQSKYPARPYLRPGAQAVISKYRGRWR